jgi:hypothetical protein
MTHPTWEKLNDFADDLLEREDAEAIRDHLNGCLPCRDQIEKIWTVKGQAREWSEPVEPGRDLWQGIEARIRTSARRPVETEARRTDRRRPGFRRARPWARPSLLAAAALVLLIVGAGIGVVLTRGGPMGLGEDVQIADPGTPGAGDADVRFAGIAQEMEEAYEPTIRELREILEAGRDELAPETVAILEESLRVIDEAIREARAALEVDPASPGAARTLNSMYETKLHVLRTAAGLTRGA